MPVDCELVAVSYGFFNDEGLSAFGDGEVCEMRTVAFGFVMTEGADAFGGGGADLIATKELNGDFAERRIFCGP